jgi:hypothetical protein
MHSADKLLIGVWLVICNLKAVTDNVSEVHPLSNCKLQA